jgi:stress response protein YsnF
MDRGEDGFVLTHGGDGLRKRLGRHATYTVRTRNEDLQKRKKSQRKGEILADKAIINIKNSK